MDEKPIVPMKKPRPVKIAAVKTTIAKSPKTSGKTAAPNPEKAAVKKTAVAAKAVGATAVGATAVAATAAAPKIAQADARRPMPEPERAIKPAVPPVQPAPDEFLEDMDEDEMSAPRGRTTKSRRESGRKATGSRSGRKPARKRPRRRSSLWTIPVILVLICMLGGMSYVAYGEAVNYVKYREMVSVVEAPKFAKGVKIDKIALQDLYREDATAKLTAHVNKMADSFGVTIVSGKKTWKVDAEKAGFTTNMNDVLRRAYNVGRYGSLEDRYQAMRNEEKKPVQFTLSATYDEKKLRAYIDEIAASMSVDAVDAAVKSFNLDDKKFTFSAGKAGKKADADQLFADVKAQLDAQNYESKVTLALSDVQPKITEQYLTDRFARISSMSTKTTANDNRNKNITLASKAISGTRIDPGEVFSFNATTGERTPEKGYKDAGAIKNGVLVQEPGGGVCQVSTTLFNAVAMADLEIVERSPHSWPSDYIEIGKDAAVNWPNQDMKFRNNKDTPIFIVMWYSKNKVYAEIYGEKLKDGMKISITSEQTSSWEPTGEMRTVVNKELEPGASRVASKARRGYTATAYRVYKDADGKTLRTEELCKSKYNATAGVREVGPKR